MQVKDGNIAFATLDIGQERAIDAHHFGHFNLSPTPFFAEFTDAFAEARFALEKNREFIRETF